MNILISVTILSALFVTGCSDTKIEKIMVPTDSNEQAEVETIPDQSLSFLLGPVTEGQLTILEKHEQHGLSFDRWKHKEIDIHTELFLDTLLWEWEGNCNRTYMDKYFSPDSVAEGNTFVNRWDVLRHTPEPISHIEGALYSGAEGKPYVDIDKRVIKEIIDKNTILVNHEDISGPFRVEWDLEFGRNGKKFSENEIWRNSNGDIVKAPEDKCVTIQGYGYGPEICRFQIGKRRGYRWECKLQWKKGDFDNVKETYAAAHFRLADGQETRGILKTRVGGPQGYLCKKYLNDTFEVIEEKKVFDNVARVSVEYFSKDIVNPLAENTYQKAGNPSAHICYDQPTLLNYRAVINLDTMRAIEYEKYETLEATIQK